MRTVVIGGGIIGLCTAFYLRNSGHTVAVIDRGDIRSGCSFGNMGYISPSHFIPIATPGIISQGLKWMLNSHSPFYIRPRISMDLLRWGIAFGRKANAATVEKNAAHLNDLLQLSRRLMNELGQSLGNGFELITRGCWMLYKSEKTGDHEKALAEQATKFGLKTLVCNRAEVQAMETETEVDVLGGILYQDDCHLDSAILMRTLYESLLRNQVHFWINTKVTGFETENGRIRKVLTDKIPVEADEVILANGSWMPATAKALGIRIMMQGGKGYSYDYTGVEKNLQIPSILVDHRTATTPIGQRLRIGGTMELSGHDDRVLPGRVRAIYNAVKLYYPKLELPAPEPSKAWFGYRPVTPDGLPYIGRPPRFQNLSFAGGHAMLGVSAAAATGLLISEIIDGMETTIPVTAFNPARFI